MNEAVRTERVAQELCERGVDALLVGAPVNLRYLTGHSGSNGLAIVDGSGRANHRFLTDFRYATQSAAQVSSAYEREIVKGDLLEAAVGALGAGAKGSNGRLGFDDARMTVKQHGRLCELVADGWELVPCAGIVERLREVKEAGEIEAIRAACELADAALECVLEGGLAGRSERDVALELEVQMRKLGARGASFPTIVAAGAHAALPHAAPRDEPVPRGTLAIVDWGSELDGYCSDCTRTYATGSLDGQAEEVYALVLEAQRAGLEAVRAGVSGFSVDAVARELVEAAGRGEEFGHGLGHGVGMEVHEAPRLSFTAPEDELLRAGNVVTIEPGVYLPGRLGVRIEDLVVVGERGCEPLTSLPKELTQVD